MIKVSIDKARSHMFELLRKVKSGERVIITKYRVSIAMMTSVAPQRKRFVKEAVEAIKRFRKGNTLGGFSVKEIIKKGRR